MNEDLKVPSRETDLLSLHLCVRAWFPLVTAHDTSFLGQYNFKHFYNNLNFPFESTFFQHGACFFKRYLSVYTVFTQGVKMALTVRVR